MLICETRGQVFLHNPKCGGIAVGTWLREHHGYVDAAPDLGAPRFPDPPHMGIWRHSTVPPDYARDYEAWCIVRHPLRRWESFYNYCRRWQPDAAALSFDEFTDQRLGWLPPQNTFVDRVAYWIQLEHLASGLAELGLAYKLEELRPDNVTGYFVPWTDRAREQVIEHFRGDFNRCGYRLPR